jgi:hypothetical protein
MAVWMLVAVEYFQLRVSKSRLQPLMWASFAVVAVLVLVVLVVLVVVVVAVVVLVVVVVAWWTQL